MRRGCTGADAPGQMHRGSINGSDMPSALGLVGNYIVLFFAKICKYALTCVNLQ